MYRYIISFTLYIYHSKQPQHCYLFLTYIYKNHAAIKYKRNLRTNRINWKREDPQLHEKTNEH